jgi:hypothetical protein
VEKGRLLAGLRALAEAAAHAALAVRLSEEAGRLLGGIRAAEAVRLCPSLTEEERGRLLAAVAELEEAMREAEEGLREPGDVVRAAKALAEAAGVGGG